MKKVFVRVASAFAAVLFLVSLTVLPSFAWGNGGAYNSIDVQVTLLPNGSAQVIELWDVDLDDDWSEIYIPKGNLGEMEIDNMQVKDLTEGVTYEYTGRDWNVYSGFDTDEKRDFKYHKCGIVETADGLELCWGVDGVGEHTYQLSYIMTNVVQKYEDGYDGFLIRFVNAGMDEDPEHVSVTIDTADVEELTYDNTKFWAFGLMGTTRLSDGRVIVESDEGGDINYCNVMCRFDEGIFEPSVSAGKTFRSLVETAFEGSNYDIDAYDDGTSGGDSATSDDSDNYADDSDWNISYDDDSSWTGIGVVGLSAATVGGLAWYALTESKRKNARITNTITRQEKKDVLYSRDIPLSGRLPEAYLALDVMDELPGKTTIMEAYLLKWLKNGWTRVDEEEKKRLFGLVSDKKVPTIVFQKNIDDIPPEDMDKVEKKLWRILVRAAGNDNILQEDELKDYAKSNYEELESFFEAVLDNGMKTARGKNHVEDIAEKKLIGTSHKTVLTDEGKKEFLNVIGFRKFLKDFTVINERQARDVGLWGDYLTFAALYGIADEVAEQFKELVPDFFTNASAYGYNNAGWDTWDLIWMMHIMNQFSNTAYNSYMAGRSASEINTASSGGGGFSSFGGGGGFSGGGFGGGGR